MNTSNPSFLKKLLIGSFAASVIVGGATGGLAGFYVASNATGQPISLPAAIKDMVGGNQNQQASPASDTKTIVVDESKQISDMVKKASPAVVSVIISKSVSQQPISDFFNFGPFGFNMPNGGGSPGDSGNGKLQQVGSGSGFLISADGLIVTNRHVVSDTAATYTVVLSNGTKYPAKVLARDPVIDLAVLKIDANNLSYLSLGNSDSLQLGQTVVAIGNALGEFSGSVTRGIISGLNRSVVAGDGISGSETISSAIQTDAAINPGNSGGPLLDLNGNVIGVNTAVSQQGQSVGFAIPINIAKRSIDSVKQTGRIVRPYLGVRYVLISADMAKQNQLPVNYGALVERGTSSGQLAVNPGSPADKAGIVENDIILEADGTKIDADHPLTDIVTKKSVGDSVTLKIYHKGDTKTVTVKLAEMPQF